MYRARNCHHACIEVFHQDRISQYQKNIFLYDIGHLSFDALNNLENLNDRLTADLHSFLSHKDDVYLLTTCLYEGQNAATASDLLSELQFRFPNKFCGAIFAASSDLDPFFDVEILPNHMSCHGDYIHVVKTWRDDSDITDRKFLCLNRRPSPIRNKFIKRFTHEIDPQNFLVSLGSAAQYLQDNNENILIDGVADSYEKQHSLMMMNPLFRRCAVKIITETSEQNSDTQVSAVWLTEKTFKCFFFRSFPIWMAVPGTVEHVRKQGFDTFDDVIDHGYDRIIDTDLRLDAVMSEVSKIDYRYNLTQLARLREKMFLRLQYNYDLAVFYAQASAYYLDRAVNRLIAKKSQIH